MMVRIYFFILFSISLASLPCQSMDYHFKGVSKELQNKVSKTINRSENILIQSDQIIRYLMNSGNFENIRVYLGKDKKALLIEAQPRSVLNSIQVTGAKNLSDELKTPPPSLKEKKPFLKENLLRYASTIKEYYINSGYLNSNIELQIRNENHFANVTIRVIEGKRSKVSKITFETKNTDLASRLSKFKKELVNQPFVKRKVDQLKNYINNFLREESYYLAKIEKIDHFPGSSDSDLHLKFHISQPYRYDFFIKGNSTKRFTTETLIRKTKEDSNIASSSIPPEKFATSHIRKLYLDRGFASIQINTKLKENNKAFRREVYIDISEGPRAKIVEIEFKGKFSRPENYYIDLLKDFSSPLIKSGYFNESDINSGFENIISELRNQGFLNAKFNTKDFIFSKDKSRVSIIADFSEGPLTQIQAIRFLGNFNFSDETLLDQTQIKSLSTLNLKKVEAAIINIEQFYKDNGFIEMKFENSQADFIKYKDGNTIALIEFKIHEGPKVKIKSLNITGNKKTKEHVILRELKIKKGETLTPKKIELSKTALEELGLFSRIEFNVSDIGTNEIFRDLTVRLEEKKPGVIRIGTGVTNERDLTVRGYVGASYNNIAGTARSINARAELNLNVADINFPENRITLGYLEPKIYDSQWDFRINLQRSQNIFEIDETEDEVNILERNDIVFLVERPLTQHLKLSYNLLGISFQNEFEKDGKTEDDPRVISKTGPILDIDYRNDPFNPKSGFFNRIAVEYSDPKIGSTDTIHFLKVTNRFSLYTPISTKLNWVNSIRFGYLKNLSSLSNSGVPFVEAFFLGGQSTVRGFNTSEERFPRNEQLSVEDIGDFLVQEDSHFGLFKSEVRFPMPFFESLEGAIFYDAGLVNVKGFDFDDSYRDSAGFGLHIITPVGPVNFELAFKLDRKEEFGESLFEFHFSIGSF